MAITLIGEIVNSCDAITGFTNGAISGDDDFVEGTGAIGVRLSSTTGDMVTTSLGAGAPYDFSSGGTEEGYHIIMWFNTKTPINATSGLGVRIGNGTDSADWYVVPSGFYKGGFITAVIAPTLSFDNIAAGTWTLDGNPTQLTAVSAMGGVFTTITSIMGNFNNCQIDQITIGEGLRADAGTVGTPNTFETVRAADEDTAFYGWWASSNGSVLGKGKLFIGPATGSATSVFTDSAFAVVFADQRVASGFYEISVRGAGTDVTWELANISAANSSSARWSLTVDSTTNSFDDTNGVYSGFDVLTLDSSCTFTGTTFIDGVSIIHGGATMTGCTFLASAAGDGVALIQTANPATISGSTFEFSDGHAIELTAAGSYTLSDVFFANYGANDTNDAAIYNNSGGAVTLSISGGDTPTIRNGTGSSTTVVNSVFVIIQVNDSLGSAIEGARVYLESNGGALADGLSITTLTRSGTVVSATTSGAHGILDGEQATIRGASDVLFDGLVTVTVTGTTTFTYTVSEYTVDYSNIVDGPFQVGETVTFVGSSAVGTIITLDDQGATGTLTVDVTSGTPVDTDTLSGGTSTATADVDTVAIAAAASATGANVTGVVIEGVSGGTGRVQRLDWQFAGNQPVIGRARRGTTSPLYKTAPINGTITSGGFVFTASMVSDE